MFFLQTGSWSAKPRARIGEPSQAWYIFWPPIHNRTIVNICSRRRNDPAMLYLIGLGLADETDVTVKGLELIKKVGRVYIEAYTSILLVDTEKLVRSMLVS